MPGHRAEEQAQSIGIRVECSKQIFGTFDFILGLSGLERFAQGGPKTVTPRVPHLEEASAVGRFGAVQVKVGIRGIRIKLAAPFEHPQRHQRIQEIVNATRMEPKVLADLLCIQWAFSEFREKSEFERAEKDL